MSSAATTPRWETKAGMTDVELCAWVLLAYLPAAVVLSLVLMGTLD